MRYKVLEMDTKGNLYFYRTSLFCKNEIIKRLMNGKYNLVDSAPLGKSDSLNGFNMMYIIPRPLLNTK